MGLTWPLIGRSEEMRTIVAAISEPGLAGILVSGPAGVGKSRIVREGLAEVASHGFEPRWVVGTMSARGSSPSVRSRHGPGPRSPTVFNWCAA